MKSNTKASKAETILELKAAQATKGKDGPFPELGGFFAPPPPTPPAAPPGGK